MVFLSEWFPDPMGPDQAHEFIELYNNASTTASLAGWSLRTDKGKIFFLTGYAIPPNGYLVLTHAKTGLLLKNTDGGLALYGPIGKLVDEASFDGAAEQGKSFSRTNYSHAAEDVARIQNFAWGDPTPGAKNKTDVSIIVTIDHYALDTILNPGLDAIQFFGIMMGVALLLAGLTLCSIQANENTSKLFFKRDQVPR